MILLRSRFAFDCPVVVSRWMLLGAFLTIALDVSAARAQATKGHTVKAKSTTIMDVSLGVFAQSTPSRTPTDIITESYGTSYEQSIQGTSPSAGVLGTFHQSFGRWLGYSVNLGYTRFTEKYAQGIKFIPNPNYVPQLKSTSSFARGSIGTNMYEITGSYLVQGPRGGHVDSFFQLGGGILSFLPTEDPSPYAVQFRPTMVFGAGMNYRLSKHWWLRAEYRGLFLKNPDFHGEGGTSSVPISKLFTVTNEPVISIVYRFGGTR